MNEELHCEEAVVKPKYHWVAIVAWLAPISIGTALGYTAPAIPSLESRFSHLHLTKDASTWFASLLALGGVFGALIGGICVEKLGRKKSLLYSSIPCVVGWLLITYAENVPTLLVGRLMTGICCGLFSLVAPIYIVEIAPPNTRGFFGSGCALAYAIGILLVYVVGNFIPWSWDALHCAIYPLLLLMFISPLPESPCWLLQKKMYVEASDAMLCLYGHRQSFNNPAVHSLAPEDEDANQLRSLWKRKAMKPFLIALGLMFFQQFSGINIVLFYCVCIFKSAASSVDPFMATIVLGVVQAVVTFVACLIIDRVGRRVLLIASSLVMSLSLGLMSVSFFFHQRDAEFHIQYGWLPLTALVIFVTAFSLGFGPIPWLLMAEIVPVNVKGLAAALSLSMNWLCMFIVTKEFEDLKYLLSDAGAYLFLSGVCLLASAFVMRLVPETKGKTLIEIEEHFNYVIQRRPFILPAEIFHST